jgi:hypothetical protein
LTRKRALVAGLRIRFLTPAPPKLGSAILFTTFLLLLTVVW